MAGAEPDWSPDGSRVAMISLVQGQLRLVTVFADGRPDRTLATTDPRTPKRDLISSPDWSPDGTRIVYVRSDEGQLGEGNLWVVEADGSGARQLTAGGGVSWPAWHPDGRRMAVEMDGAIAVIDTETGSQETWVKTSSRQVALGSWSPDGTRLAYVEDGRLRVARGPGRADTPLSTGLERDSDPVWSPDGTQILFARGVVAPKAIPTIYVASSDGSGAVPVTSGGQPDWSPAGDRIVFSRGQDVFVREARGPELASRAIVPEPGGALVSGSLAPGDLPASVWVEFGRTSAYGRSTIPVTVTAPEFEVKLSGLEPATWYHARLVARGRTGEASTADVRFLTGYTELLAIDGGAPATRSLDVTLTITAPARATGVAIGNGSEKLGRVRRLAPSLRWRLARGPRVGEDPRTWTATVSVKLHGPNLSGLVVTDTIVVDLDPPRIVAARLLPGVAGRGDRLELEVEDSGGVTSVQVSDGRDGSARWRRFARILPLPAGGTDLWARVRDVAGNVSEWRAVAQR